MNRTPALIAVALLLGATARAEAQSADTLGWRFTGALGYVQTSGNTKLSTVNLGDKIIYRPSGFWTFTQTSAWVYGKTEGVETANQLVASVRGDYNISPRLSIYGLVGFERNRYAGIGRRLEESAGLSFWAVRSPRRELQIDLGAGAQQERDLAGVQNGFLIARLAPRYKHQLNARAYFEEQLEFLANLEETKDLRTVSNTSLVAPLSNAIALRLGYLLRYDALPPAGSRKLDTTFTTGIQVTL